MTEINKAAHVLMLLRGHLERAARTRGAKSARASTTRTPTERLQRLAEAGASEADLERVMIWGMLEDQFGASLASEPKFQLVVDEVLGMLRDDAETQELMRRALGVLGK
ncbi:MAG: hypothetical protein ABUL42_00245 [Terricaulis silvestris]